VQWYEYEPGVANVNEKCPPGATIPESQPLVSDVDVCATESLLVHVTVVPVAIARSSGAKARLPSACAPDGIVTEVGGPPGAGAGDGDGVGDGDAGDDEYELPHAMDIARALTTTASRIVSIRTSILTTSPPPDRFSDGTISQMRNHNRFSKVTCSPHLHSTTVPVIFGSSEHDVVRNVVSVRPRDRGADGYRHRPASEAEVVHGHIARGGRRTA
jgi:hypothetical protein